ncbi:hypothetical protein N9235_02120 [Gammaproteobacteria bacterium]|nr:hypothetical protein [Gammaproteobacteria bacterium]
MMVISTRELFKIVISTWLFFSACTSTPVYAEVEVYYAGFAYLGDFNHIKKNYRHTASINKEEGGRDYLDKVLYGRIKRQHFSNFDLKFDVQAPDTKGSAIALAFALDRETTSVEQIGNRYKVITELSAQALFFDYHEKKLIRSYPVVVQYIDNLNESPTDSYYIKTVNRLYTEDVKANIFSELITLLKTVYLNRDGASRIQVVQVDVEDKALAVLPDRFLNDQDNFRNYIASTFTGYLSKNQSVPILPYSTGHAIGNKMAFTVANGDVFNLEIPEPDYEIRLTVRGFKKALLEKTPVESAWAYGAYINIEVIEPMSGTSYINTQFVNAASKTIPASQKNVDDWATYQETLIGLFDSLTREVSNPSKKWVKEHSPAKDARKALKRFNNEVLKQCV